MWKVEPPPEPAAEEAAKSCASGIGRAEFRLRVQDRISAFVNNSSMYRRAACSNQLHELTSETFEIEGIGAGELVSIYNNQMARSGRPGRVVYDAIMRKAPDGLCAYCQYGQASTLDHFVPKTLISGLAIDPWNLIPCCKDCNYKLNQQFSTSADTQLLHPYYMPDIGRWLRARTLPGPPVSLEFFPDPPTHLTELTRTRIQNQFYSLGLDELYSVVSASDLIEIASSLTVLAGGGRADIRAHLNEMAEHLAGVTPNGRRRVIYEALAADRDFCDGGFRVSFATNLVTAFDQI